MKVKKSFVYLIATIALFSISSGVTASATETSAVSNNSQYMSLVPYAEETTWFYQYVDGRLQKRLWSNTYGKWLTDWEWA